MSIQKRTVFYDDTAGIARFWDWAVTTTTLGVMAEPFCPADRYGFSPTIEFDATNEICRIDEIRAAPIDRHKFMLSGNDDQVLHGGALMPRNGK